MRVERASVDTVKERLDEIKRKIANKAEEKASRKSAIEVKRIYLYTVHYVLPKIRTYKCMYD